MIGRQHVVFLAVGFLTVAIDLLAYRCLLWTGIVGAGLAKAVSFLVGTNFAYFANRAWTFNEQPHAPGSALRFSLLYAVTLGANVAVNAAVLWLLAGNPVAVSMGFLVATAVSALLNFLGMRLFVFRFRPVVELT